MTRARNTAKGLVTPPPLHRLMEAVLLLCVSLVQGAVSTFQMIRVFFGRDWHTTKANKALPQTTSSIHAPTPILRDNCFAIPQDEACARSIKESRCFTYRTIQALILRDLRFAQIVSKDGGVLTTLSPLIPTNVGIQGRAQTLFRLAASIPCTQSNRSWIPTFVGMSGDEWCSKSA